ncbi:subtilisin-like protease SBT1.7 [Canna indica]|uniref:Subtilisin-like protease SBT1.7 n=1 Tax=Canna indica TaxID=4628 RepID=A0AAQ3QB59_9LILI|nr:subtilisin-like protease SBT1.7 [Canna indica]
MECTQLISSPKFAIILLLLFLSNSASLVSSDEVETYIVHVLPKANFIFTSALERVGWHESLLPNKSRLVYSYSKIISGFAAKLSSDELSALKLVDGFVQAVPDRTLALQTTRSPEFLGLLEGRLRLGNGLVLTGETLYQPADFPTSTQYPLVYPGKIGDSNATYCASLDGINVTGMVVYADAKVSVIASKRTKCSDYLSQYGEELNYPSFMVTLNAANNYTAVVSRNVTNVGKSKSSYTAQITSPAGVSMSVNPKLLSFTQANQVLKYTVTFSSNSSSARTSASTQGRLQWNSLDDTAAVRSPVVVGLS